MMQDRWPPEPPRFDPRRNEQRASKTLIVVLLALLIMIVVVGVAGIVMTYTSASVRRSESGAAITRTAERRSSGQVRQALTATL